MTISTTKKHAGLLILGEILAFTPLHLLSLGIVLYLIVRMLSVGKGVLTKAAFSFGIVVSLIIYFAVIAWVCHFPLSSALILTFLNVCVGLACWYMHRHKLTTSQPLETNRYELIALFVALAAAFVLLSPVIQQASGDKLAQVVTAGGDNTAHLQMVKVDYLNRGLSYGFHNRVNQQELDASYPQGWHFMTVVFMWLTEPFIHYRQAPRNILLIFYMMAVLWYGVMIFLATRVAGLITEKVYGRKHPFAIIAIAVVIAAATLHWVLDLFTHGFEAEIASYVFCLLELYFLIEAFERPAAKRYPLLILAMGAAATADFFWTFLAPITLTILGIAFVITFLQEKRWPKPYVWVSVITLAAFAFVQPLLYKLYPPKVGMLLIQQRGDIQNTSMYTLLFMFFIILGYAIVRWKNKRLRIVFLSSVMAFLVSLGLFEYQKHTIHELRYFYFKSTFLFIVLAAILLASLAHELLQFVLSQLPKQDKQHTFKYASILAIVAVLGVMVCWQTRSLNTDAYLHGTIAGVNANQVGLLIDASATSPENGYYTTFLGSCDRGADIRASQLVGSLAFSTDPRINSTSGQSFDPGDGEELGQLYAIKHVAVSTKHRITVISSDEALTQKLTDYLGSSITNVHIQTLDPNPQDDSSITACPNRTRDLTLYPISMQ